LLFKNILVPYDGSDPSKNALKAALDMAKTSSAKLHLLHVIQEIILPNYYTRSQLDKTMKEYEKEIYADLKEKATQMLKEQQKKAESAGVEVSINTAYGNTAKEILGFVKKNKIDLVIIGTTSRKGLSKIIALGSVARKISEESPAPVLLIH
jgi:nucleotide-binding universal stress UspA family protein